MALRDGPFGDLRVPLTWTAGLAVLLAVISAIAFLAFDHRETVEPGPLDPARRMAEQAVAPVSSAAAAPVRWTGDIVGFITSYWDAAGENRRLRREVAELRQVRDMAIALRATNQRYESMLGLRTEPDIRMVTARSIAESRGPFANSRLIDAGADRTIAIGNPVMSDRGLVGRIVGVGPHVSRVLLLTDISSRTPVMVNRTNARAMLSGDGGPNPRLAYLRSRVPLQAGDLIVTSGDGGVFPRGLPVGVAVRAVDGSWRVALAADAAPIDLVKVMLFQDFSQLLGGGVAAGQMPTPATEDPMVRAGSGITYIPGPRPAPAPAAAPAPTAPPTPGPAAPRAAPSPTPAPAPALAPRLAPPAATPAARPASSPPAAARPPAMTTRPSTTATRPSTAPARPTTPTSRSPAAATSPASPSTTARPARPATPGSTSASPSTAAAPARARPARPRPARPAATPAARPDTPAPQTPPPTTAEPPF